MTDADDFLIKGLKKEIERLNLQLDAAERSAKKATFLHVLTVAQSYGKWLIDEGAGSTYSTFCDDFGYQAQPGEDRPSLYRKILTIFDAAQK